MIQLLKINKTKKIKIDKNSIIFKFWKYFLIFAASILLVLWMFQIVFLNNFYETMKINEVRKIGNILINNFNDNNFENQIQNYSQKKGMNITVIDKNGYLILPLNYNSDIKPKIIDGYTFNNLFSSLNKQNNNKISIIKYKNLENSTIVYSGYLGEKNNEKNYVLIKTVLEPVDATIDILQKMLIIVSALSMLLALILSYFMSKMLSKPLTNISNTAKKFGNGNYNIQFTKGQYSEINNLVDALNYSINEVIKTMKLRKDIIANVSHDLKTPLTVIKSYAELIRDISGENKEKREKQINIIIEEADNLSELVNDLLEFSKLESNIEKIKREAINLSDITKKIIKRIELKKENEKFKFIFETSGDCIIFGDRKKLEQVIYNLINNAINYSKDIMEIKIKVIEKNDIVRFDCIDNGIGIEKDKIKNIWDRFYRISDNRARTNVGSGLGLYIVKNILEMHNFKFGVKSELNKGSDFYFIANKIN